MKELALPGDLGAIALEGLDVKCVTDEMIDEIKRLIYKHKLVVLRDQRLSPEKYVAVARRFGQVEPYFQQNYHHPAHPEIFVSSNVPMDGKKVGVSGTGRYWHADYQFFPKPLSIVIIRPEVIPSGGRSTLFVDMGKALRRLPAALVRQVEGAVSITDPRLKYKVQPVDIDKAIDEILMEASKIVAPLRRRAVVEHPVTGERILYMSPGFTVGLEGLSYQQNREFMNALYDAIIVDEYITKHEWRENDLIFWDNISLMHSSGPSVPGNTTQYRVTVYDSSPGATPDYLGKPPPIERRESAQGFGIGWREPWVLGTES